MDKRIKKLTTLSMVLAIAMVLSFIESRMPLSVAIPGVKIGFANIAIVFALYKLGAKEAVCVSVVRVFLVSFLFGNSVSLMYSLAGAVLSLTLMLLLKRLSPFSELGVSIAGGVAHNIGQIAMACIILKTNIIAYYLPFLLLSGTVAGVIIGIVSAILIKRIKI